MENYHGEQEKNCNKTAAETQTGIFDQRLHVYKTGICPSHE